MSQRDNFRELEHKLGIHKAMNSNPGLNSVGP